MQFFEAKTHNGPKFLLKQQKKKQARKKFLLRIRYFYQNYIKIWCTNLGVLQVEKSLGLNSSTVFATIFYFLQ